MGKTKTILQKVDHDEKAESYIPDEETINILEKPLNELEIGNLPEKEFRIMIVKMIQDLRKRMQAKIEKKQEMFTKDLKELKNKQMNNTIQGVNSRITEAEEQINYLEDRMVEITVTEKNIEKIMKINRGPKRPLGQH